jgi:CubicO group peptidase (beta-lactamase class C family)
MTRMSRWTAVGVLWAVGLPSLGDEPRDDDFPKAEPGAVGIDLGAFERLKKRAEQTDSDAVVVVKDGKLVAEWTFGKDLGPIHAMSATKSVVGLAVGRLIDDGKITSLDQPVYEFYPEWDQGRKRQITIRHLLNHTSGLQNNLLAGEIYNSHDFVQYALAADLSDDPGAKFSYNNKAVNLLAGIIQKVSGQRMDRYIAGTLFKPLGITQFSWELDRAGNAHGLAGLHIVARDFAKVGQVMLDRGVWRGKRIVSEKWVEVCTTPGQKIDPTSGLLWWLDADEVLTVDDAFVKTVKEFGPSDATIEAIELLKVKPSRFWPTFFGIISKDPVTQKRINEVDQLARTGKLRPKTSIGRPFGFSARGYLGQWLVVIPESRLVAVRQYRSPIEATSQRPARRIDHDEMEKLDQLNDFPQLVRALVPAKRSD